MLRTVGLLLLIVTALSVHHPVFADSGEVPCLLIYLQDTDMRVSGKPLLPYEGSTKRYRSQCVGLKIEHGTIEVIVGTRRKALLFKAPITLTETDLNAANSEKTGSLNMFERVGQWLGRTDRERMGSRSGADNVSEFLVGVFSGTLVIEPEGLRIPVSTGQLLDIASFRLYTADALRTPIDGVDLSHHVISMRAAGLRPGKSYRWTATIMHDGRMEELSGRFAVANTVVTQFVQEQLRARLGSLDPSDPMYLLESASVYSENSLHGNASILITQWYSEDQARPDHVK